MKFQYFSSLDHLNPDPPPAVQYAIYLAIAYKTERYIVVVFVCLRALITLNVKILLNE